MRPKTRDFAPLTFAALLAACHAASTNPAPVYSVDTSGADWIVTFQTSGVIRVHLRCGDQGYITSWVGPERPVHIHPGQWMEWTYQTGGSVAVASLPNLNHC